MTATPHTRRRTLLTASAASAGALALAACGDDSNDNGDNGDNGADTGNDENDAAPQSPEGSGGGAAGGELAALADVPVGEATAATTPDGEDALLFRADDTTVAAFSAICTHQGCGVQPAGAELHCPCHNSVFDAATGEVLSGPAGEPLPAIPVRIEGERIVTE